jgi:hypothetical protein
MNIPFIGFLSFCFVGMTLIARIMESTFITAGDVAVINDLTIFTSMNVGPWTIPVLNVSYFTEGLPRLVRFDYPFFGGNAAFVQYFIYSLTAAMAFGAFIIVVGLLYQAFARLR